VADGVRLEDIQSALSQWARAETTLKDENRLLRDRIEELTLVLKDAVAQVQAGFELPQVPGATLQLVIEEALLSVASAASWRIRTVASQKDEINRLASKVTGLEQEAQEAVNRIVEALELPPNKHRTLRNAVTEAVDMVQEAKSMVRENL
jgi:hypothetical protein